MLVISDLPFIHSLAQHAMQILPSFLVLHISNTLWAFAALVVSHPTFVEAVTTAALTKIGAFGSQSLSATAWSLSKLVWRDQTLLDAISAQSVPWKRFGTDVSGFGGSEKLRLRSLCVRLETGVRVGQEYSCQRKV